MRRNPGPTPAAHSASPGMATTSGAGETSEARNSEPGLQEQQASERATSGTDHSTAGQRWACGHAGKCCATRVCAVQAGAVYVGETLLLCGKSGQKVQKLM